MSAVIPLRLVLAGVALLLAAAAGAAVNGWRWEVRLAAAAEKHAEALAEIARTAAADLHNEQVKRQELEQRIQLQNSANHRKFVDAQTNADRLRDRLATSELRLSVLLQTGPSNKNCGVPASTDAGRVVHEGVRAELDPAHAQRIISITNYGDQGIIALKACQSYVREISSHY